MRMTTATDKPGRAFALAAALLMSTLPVLRAGGACENATEAERSNAVASIGKQHTEIDNSPDSSPAIAPEGTLQVCERWLLEAAALPDRLLLTLYDLNPADLSMPDMVLSYGGFFYWQETYAGWSTTDCETGEGFWFQGADRGVAIPYWAIDLMAVL